MNIKEFKINNKMLVFLASVLILGGEILISPAESVLGRDSWLGIVIAILVNLILCAICGMWFKAFAGKTWGDVLTLAYGKVLAKIIIILYILLLLFLICTDTKSLEYFWISVYMRRTPKIIYITLIAAFSCFIASKGLIVLGRFAKFLVYGFILMIIFYFFLLFNQMDFNNLLPVARTDWVDFTKVSASLTFIPFGAISLFILLLPHFIEPQKAGASICKGVLIAGFSFILITLINTFVLGDGIIRETFPLTESLKMITINDSFVRIEVFGVVAILSIAFLRIGILVFLAGYAFGQLFGLAKYSFVFPLLFIIITCLCENLFIFIGEIFQTILYVLPYFDGVFYILIPLLTLILGVLRKRRKPA